MYVCMLSDVCDVFFTKTTNIYISAKNKDNDTKPSGYDPWGPPRSSMVSRMTLSSKSRVRNPQCPPSTCQQSFWVLMTTDSSPLYNPP